jgi:hypothetical protein
MFDYQYDNIQYFRWIENVTAYATATYGAEIDMTAEEDAFIYEVQRNRISVKGTTPPRDKLYILLHEVGHLSRLKENMLDNTFFMSRAGAQNEREKTMTIMEEVLAWRKAEDIADRLDIPIEKRAWQRLINKTVNKYVSWACDKEI